MIQRVGNDPLYDPKNRPITHLSLSCCSRIVSAVSWFFCCGCKETFSKEEAAYQYPPFPLHSRSPSPMELEADSEEENGFGSATTYQSHISSSP